MNHNASHWLYVPACANSPDRTEHWSEHTISAPIQHVHTGAGCGASRQHDFLRGRDHNRRCAKPNSQRVNQEEECSWSWVTSCLNHSQDDSWPLADYTLSYAHDTIPHKGKQYTHLPHSFRFTEVGFRKMAERLSLNLLDMFVTAMRAQLLVWRCLPGQSPCLYVYIHTCLWGWFDRLRPFGKEFKGLE